MRGSAAAASPSAEPATDVGAPVVLRWLGRVDYERTWRAMQRFVDERSDGTADEIWFLEHPPVFTLGMNSRPEHLLGTGAIPVVQTDRGGQVTYHGPGQLVVYPLLDLGRARLGVRPLVEGLERATAATVGQWGIEAAGRRDAPGVYVGARKLASIGLRVRRGCSYHGLAINVAMDLEPFRRINPCGYAGLEMTQVSELGGPDDPAVVADALVPRLLDALGFAPVDQSATRTWRQDVSSV
jgi:lipoyl(octanoyl) transferase